MCCSVGLRPALSPHVDGLVEVKHGLRTEADEHHVGVRSFDGTRLAMTNAEIEARELAATFHRPESARPTTSVVVREPPPVSSHVAADDV